MVNFEFENKKYVLTFTRRTASETEANGLKMSGDIDEMPITTINNLVYGSFQAHHSDVSEDKRFEIWSLLPNKDELITNLMEDFASCVNSLFAEPKAKNAIEWKAKK